LKKRTKKLPSPEGRVSIAAPLRDPAIALLWSGLATSAVGDQLFAVVLSWIAVRLLGPNAGYVAALQAAAGLLTALFAGHWADRVEQRRLMMSADLTRAATLLGLMALWLALGDPPVWGLCACVLVLAAGQAVFRPAMQATLPVLVTNVTRLPATNALLDTTERIARLLGPGLVGIASATVPLVHFVTIDAVSFLVSAGAILGITRLRPAAVAHAIHHATILATLTRGFTTVRRHPVLGYGLATTAIINGTWYATIFLGLPLLITHAGVTGPGGSGLAAYGLVISAYGATNLLGTLVVGSHGIARHPARLIFWGNIVLAIGIAGIGLAGLLVPARLLLPCLMAGAAISAVGGPMQDITVATLRQTALPLPDMAAAVRAFMVLNQVGLLAALLVAPLLFTTIGAASVILLCAAAMLAVGVVGLIRHGERD
jgi:hypothetical protein